MGHYRSEMGYEDEDARRADQERLVMEATAAHLQKAIDEKGLAFVLADFIVSGPTLTSIKYRRTEMLHSLNTED